VTLVNYLTAGASILALASSLFVWLRQRQRESPRLRAYWSGQRMLWSFRSGDTEKDIGIGMEVTILFGNLSSLPDAILGVNVRVYSAAVKDWLPCRLNTGDHYGDDPTPQFPLNLQPRTTQWLRLKLVCSVPLGVLGGSEIMSDESYERAQAYLGPLRYRVEIIGLGNRRHLSEFDAVFTGAE
jgi:hypothetical protein